MIKFFTYLPGNDDLNNSMRLPRDWFYVPLPSIRVDVGRLKEELEPMVLQGNACGLTVSKDYAGRPYAFDLFNGNSGPGKDGAWRVYTGERDSDLTHWSLELENSYTREVGKQLSSYLGMPAPRVRSSRISAGIERKGIDMHRDPHTPFRVHIALDTAPGATWSFVTGDGRRFRIHQPADGIPIYIDTAGVQHGVDVVSASRWHLWYQWYERPPAPTIARIMSLAGSQPIKWSEYNEI